MSSQRVFLHVGAPKTGTTFLQWMLFGHRDRLKSNGLLYPADHYDDHFFAAVDLQGLPFFGQPRPDAAGAWGRVVDQVLAWSGSSIVSHDVFASAQPADIERVHTDLRERELHVVMTVRDLSRSLPSHWQEDVKNGEVRTFPEWLAGIRSRDSASWNLRWFWQVEDVPAVLDRWGAGIPPDRVHVVTVPPSGAPRDLLWKRFAQVLRIAADDYDLDIPHPNTGLGVAETELVRRVNELRDDRMDQATHEHIVKGVLAHDTLSSAELTRVALPATVDEDVRALAQQWVDELGRRGYDVVGDLGDLYPAEGDGGHELESVTDSDVARSAVYGLHEVLVRLHEERRAAFEREDDLRRRLDAAEAVIAEHRSLANTERLKRAVVEIGQRTRWVEAVLNVYRRLRGRR